MGASREVCLRWEDPPYVCEASSPHGLGTQVNNQNEGLYPEIKPKVISSLEALSVWYFVRQQKQQQKIN